MTERNRQAYQRWAATYDTDPNPQLELEHSAVVRAVDAQPGNRILDAGCGTGRYVEEFARAGAEVVGIDFCAEMLARARSKTPAAEFVVADLTKPLPFADHSFDKVNCAQALRHIFDVQPAFSEFARLLRPAGLLVFSVSHPEMDWADYELREEPEFILSREADIYPHTVETYRVALERAGLVQPSFVDLHVAAAIAHLLTLRSYELVAGRPQILLGTARKAG